MLFGRHYERIEKNAWFFPGKACSEVSQVLKSPNRHCENEAVLARGRKGRDCLPNLDISNSMRLYRKHPEVLKELSSSQRCTFTGQEAKDK